MFASIVLVSSKGTKRRCVGSVPVPLEDLMVASELQLSKLGTLTALPVKLGLLCP